MDRDVSEVTLLKYPQMYSTGRSNHHFNSYAIMMWIINAWVFGTILCLLYYYAFQLSSESDTLYVFGSSVFVGMFLSLQAKLVFLHHQWKQSQLITLSASIIAFFILLELLSLQASYENGSFYSIAPHIYENPKFWFFACFTVPLILFLVDLTGYLLHWFFSPTEEMKFREIDKLETQETSMMVPKKCLSMPFTRGIMSNL